jgi:F-type H+-transporting ATPase subunit a
MSHLVFTHRLSSAGSRWPRVLALLLALVTIGAFPVLLATSAMAAEDKPGAEHIEAAAAGAHAEEHHGLTTYAPLIDLGYFKVTNSMIVTWIVAVLIIIFARYATKTIKDVPDGAQNFWEWLVESLHNFLESVIGHELVKKTFWFFATLFIFIL